MPRTPTSGPSALVPFFKNSHAILSAEAEAVDEGVADGQGARLPGDVVEIALGVRRELVDGRRNTTSRERLDGRDGAQCAGCAEQMADHRLHRAHRHAIGVLAE